MKFPVSREQLRNIKTDVEDEILQHNIEKAIDFIKGRIRERTFEPSFGRNVQNACR